jgi:glycosyltransferase involved in cell wall biosynthesis
MRLLFVARRYWPAVGGVETFLRDLARELATRHDVTVLAHRNDNGPSERLTDSLRPPPSFLPFEDDGVRVEPLRVSLGRRVAMLPLASQVMPGLRRHAYGRIRVAAGALYSLVVAPVIGGAARQADLIHMFGSDLVAAAAIRAARQLRVPSVVTPFAHRGQWGDGPVDAAVYRAADRVVALLDVEASLYLGLGVPRGRVAVCGVGSPGVRSGRGGWIRRRFGVSGPLVLFLGVRRPYKGYNVLLRAASNVANERPDVVFAFVGPGPRLVDFGDARVLDVGSASEEERSAWLDAADLLCLPSEGEIFPLSILEAWSAKTPVLTSDIPTLAELAEKSGGAATASREPQAFARAILTLLHDSKRLADMGRAGHAFWSQHHTVDAVSAWHEQLYASLLDGRRE